MIAGDKRGLLSADNRARVVEIIKEFTFDGGGAAAGHGRVGVSGACVRNCSSLLGCPVSMIHRAYHKAKYNWLTSKAQSARPERYRDAPKREGYGAIFLKTI